MPPNHIGYWRKMPKSLLSRISPTGHDGAYSKPTSVFDVSTWFNQASSASSLSDYVMFYEHSSTMTTSDVSKSTAVCSRQSERSEMMVEHGVPSVSPSHNASSRRSLSAAS